MDGLFTCLVVDWKRIPPNQIGDKLFSFSIGTDISMLEYIKLLKKCSNLETKQEWL